MNCGTCKFVHQVKHLEKVVRHECRLNPPVVQFEEGNKNKPFLFSSVHPTEHWCSYFASDEKSPSGKTDIISGVENGLEKRGRGRPPKQ